ncbi:hypothetical protein D3C77_500880 [compost metagenome]
MAPVSRYSVRAVNPRFDPEQLTDRFLLVHLFNNQEILIPATILMHHQHPLRLVGRSRHFLELLDRHRYRFFANHMLARRKCTYSYILMYVIWSCNKNDLDRLIAKHFLIAFIRSIAVLFGNRSAYRIRIKRTDNFKLTIVLDQFGMIAAHTSIAYNNYSMFVIMLHDCSPPPSASLRLQFGDLQRIQYQLNSNIIASVVSMTILPGTIYCKRLNFYIYPDI